MNIASSGTCNSSFIFEIGHEAIGIASIINEEERAFEFAIDPATLLVPGETSLLDIEPMQGFIQPKSRYFLADFFFSHYGVNFGSLKLAKLIGAI